MLFWLAECGQRQSDPLILGHCVDVCNTVMVSRCNFRYKNNMGRNDKLPASSGSTVGFLADKSLLDRPRSNCYGLVKLTITISLQNLHVNSPRSRHVKLSTNDVVSTKRVDFFHFRSGSIPHK